MPNQELLKKLHAVRSVLNQAVLERKDETDGILLSILSGANTLFFGDPGTAKTFHIQLASTLLGLSNFDILMSETVKPDQIFGPTDIPALAQGRQQTKYTGYAPDCEILFFDEIFKANATVLNPLLWLINEHRFRDGDNGVIKTKNLATFAASNELPTDPILAALYDRFLLRFNVHYLKDEQNTRTLISRALGQEVDDFQPMLTREEVDQLRTMTKQVSIPEDMVEIAIKIRRQVEYTMSFKISDRRFLKSIRVIQAMAVLNNRLTVEVQDLEVLANMFWNEPAQIAKIQSIVYSSTSGDTAEISTYVEQANAIKLDLAKGKDLKKKLKELKGLYKLCKGFPNSRFARQAAAEIKSIGLIAVHLIKERKTFQVVHIRSTTPHTFKVSQASAQVWSTKELRTFGFRHRRKGNYWYYQGKLSTLQPTFTKAGIELVVASIGKVS
jgi:MoxR-like ATPase